MTTNDPTLFDDHAPTHVGDPWTSHAAAASVNRGTQRWRVLVALRNAGVWGATDSELGETLGIRETAAGTRRKELERLGYCVPTEFTRPTRYGNEAVVHVITGDGYLAAQP